ncbi:MAG: hypothetical protein NC453_31115 [Muribaculum sp.]|nr:hypothetical protein [Muribaculum sp.]
MVPILTSLIDAYSTLASGCRMLEMKYVDLWTVPSDNLSDQQIALLKDALFSSQLKEKAEPEDKTISIAEFKDGNTRLRIKYGSSSNSSAGNRGIALESRCIVESESEIKNDRILAIAEKVNGNLYDAFIWAVSPEVLNAMRNPQ